MILNSNPLNEKQLSALNELVREITPEQILWLNGFLEGRLAGLNPQTSSFDYPESETEQTIFTRLTILYGSETGNSKTMADKLAEKAVFKKISAEVVSMYDYDFSKLTDEENLAVVVSTHGEGDPPDMAEDFYKYITSEEAPNLVDLNFSVLALGDKTYKYFCKTGEDIDEAFKELGAFRVTPLVKCDLDYEADAEIWMNNFLMNLSPSLSVSNNAPLVKEEKTSEEISLYSKNKPFMAKVLEKTRISGDESDKEVYHIELSIEGSGLTYEPGDSIGIFTKNPAVLVEKILQKTGFDPNQIIDFKDEEITISEALSSHLEITILTFDILQKYFERTKNKKLEKILNDDKLLDDYIYGRDVLDLLEDFPHEWNVNKFVEILRYLPARLYSISSSQESVGNNVHATVALVRYEKKGRERLGACSYNLADEIEIGGEVPVYIDKNPSFKLPQNGEKIIMVGAGTGIAPYRAFMQERECLGIEGNSWLFYGDRTSKNDFLYQEEWDVFMESNFLEKMDVAFSRDQEEKKYVQHKLKENKEEIFQWLEDGAHFYICGDMKNMAKDVNNTMLEIIQEQGGLDNEQATKYVKNLKREKRYQTDVY